KRNPDATKAAGGRPVLPAALVSAGKAVGGDLGGADARAHGAEALGGAATEEGDSHQADDGDERHQEGVLDQRRATLVATEPSPDVRSAMLLPISDEIHRSVSPSFQPLSGELRWLFRRGARQRCIGRETCWGPGAEVGPI